jgi:hypothetical protein
MPVTTSSAEFPSAPVPTYAGAIINPVSTLAVFGRFVDTMTAIIAKQVNPFFVFFATVLKRQEVVNLCTAVRTAGNVVHPPKFGIKRFPTTRATTIRIFHLVNIQFF